MINLDLQGTTVTPYNAEWLLRERFPDGVPPGTMLFWRVGYAQRSAFMVQKLQTADLHTLRYEVDNGMQKMGLFAGIPYFLDRAVPDDQIWLQEIKAAESVAQICGAALLSLDVRKPEAV